MTHRRREVLAGSLSLLFGMSAGCLAEPDSTQDECPHGPLSDVLLSNDTDTGQSVSFSLTNLGTNETVVSDVIDLAGGSTKTYENPITTAHQYRFTVSIDGGPSNERIWDVPPAEAKCGYHGMIINVRSDEIEFVHMQS